MGQYIPRRYKLIVPYVDGKAMNPDERADKRAIPGLSFRSVFNQKKSMLYNILFLLKIIYILFS